MAESKMNHRTISKMETIDEQKCTDEECTGVTQLAEALHTLRCLQHSHHNATIKNISNNLLNRCN